MAKMPRIPGLSYIPVEETDEKPFIGIGFNMKTFAVPRSFTYGNNRRVIEFEKLKTISEGRFGTVYKVKDSADNQIYALKKLKIPDCDPDNPEPMPQNFLRQIKNLKEVKHENIVNLKEVVVGKNLNCNYLLLDYCQYSLVDIIDHVDKVFFQHQHIKNIMLQMLLGLTHLHKFNILHRDLCPKNILFTDTGVLKISDFGTSRTESDGDMTPNPGSQCYRAPEILFGSTKYTKAVDIWSTGVIFGEMVRQKPLFSGEVEGDVVKSIINILGSPTEKVWPGFSNLPVPRRYHLTKKAYTIIRAEFYNQTLTTVHYIQRFLKYNPVDRPSAEALMEDPYYIEHPVSCTNDALMLPLRLSKKL